MLQVALLCLAAAPDAGAPDAGPPTGPLPSAFAQTIFTADAIVEFEVPIDGDPKKKPVRLWAEGLARAKPTRVVATRALVDRPPEVKARPWEILNTCFHRAKEAGEKVKVLLVVGGSPLEYSLLPMGTMGFGMSSTPGYSQLVAAIVEAYGWHEERMRAVGAEQLWLKQRAALVSDNGFLRHLAAEWLVQHEAGEVVDAAWGAPGTSERAANEAKANVAPNCSRSP
ncbi:MAG: hypothetical protein U0228_31125 [Myxococcaceae bacterium]